MTLPVLVSMVAKLELRSITNTMSCSLDTVNMRVRGVIKYILLCNAGASIGCVDAQEDDSGVASLVVDAVVVPEQDAVGCW